MFYINEFLLKDFIYINKSIIPEDLCENIILSQNDFSWTKHEWYNKNTDTSTSHVNKELDVCFLQNEFSNLLFHYVTVSFENYFQISKKFNLDNIFTNMITSCSSPRLNRYTPNTLMEPHFDHIHSLFDGDRKGIPVLSLVGLLNNDYIGGEFIFFNNYELNLQKGDIVVFPSCFLFPHRVNEIKEGTRYSFVSWGW